MYIVKWRMFNGEKIEKDMLYECRWDGKKSVTDVRMLAHEFETKEEAMTYANEHIKNGFEDVRVFKSRIKDKYKWKNQKTAI